MSIDLARGGSVTGGATTGFGFGGCKTRPSMGVRRGVRVSINLARGGNVTGGATTGFGFGLFRRQGIRVQPRIQREDGCVIRGARRR